MASCNRTYARCAKNKGDASISLVETDDFSEDIAAFPNALILLIEG
jgi:hypothetical protein